MDFINRQIATICQEDLKTFPVITLTGPRQSGKSTLLRKLLPDWVYVNLEEPSMLDFATQDPKGFFKTYPDHIIIDEIQRAPKLLSQLQVIIDADRRPGRFAVTGSHNLLLLEHISQTLAGRTSVRHLLPFSYAELQGANHLLKDLETNLFLGGFPLVHQASEKAQVWLDSYMQTYVERDVRMIRNITDLTLFRRFLRLCAGRTGQLLDLSGIGGDAGVTHNTIRSWIGVLETGFIAFQLTPYFRNFSKRIIKSPKLYFYDTGLLCRLLDIRSAADLLIHPFRGNIFENWCVVEALKAFYNQGLNPGIFFWRDQSIEVDLLLELDARKLAAFECKSGATAHENFIETPVKLKSIAQGIEVLPNVVFGGDDSQIRSSGNFYTWKDFAIKVATLDF